MEDVLKRLLEAEQRAEAIVAAADQACRQLLDEAAGEAQAIEQSFQSRADEIKAAHIEKAEARAAEAVAELARRHDETDRGLRAAAQQHEEQAVSAALNLFATTQEP